MKRFLVRLRATLRTGGFLGVHSSLTASLGKTSVAWETRSINKVPETRGRLPKLTQREWLSCGCKQWLEAGRWLHPWGDHTRLSLPRISLLLPLFMTQP